MKQFASVTIKQLKHLHKYVFVSSASFHSFGSASFAKGRYIYTVHMNHIDLTGISGKRSKLIN